MVKCRCSIVGETKCNPVLYSGIQKTARRGWCGLEPYMLKILMFETYRNSIKFE